MNTAQPPRECTPLVTDIPVNPRDVLKDLQEACYAQPVSTPTPLASGNPLSEENWRLDCNKSLHSAAELVPGRSIDTVSFCGWAPCHAEAALCEYTSCNIPSSRMCDVIIIHGKPINSCICHQDRMETLCLDVPLLDPTGDLSGPRAPGSFLPVKDVWISYYWFLRQTSHITRLNGFNDRGTPAGREPDIENVHHIDGSKPFLEACKQPFLFGFPRLFPSPIWTTLLSSANHLPQPTRSSSKLHRLAWSMPRSRVEHFSVDGVEPEERQEQWFSLRIIEDLARMVQYMPKQRQLSLPDGKKALPPSPLQTS